jgi:hypothetical protein
MPSTSFFDFDLFMMVDFLSTWRASIACARRKCRAGASVAAGPGGVVGPSDREADGEVGFTVGRAIYFSWARSAGTRGRCARCALKAAHEIIHAGVTVVQAVGGLVHADGSVIHASAAVNHASGGVR